MGRKKKTEFTSNDINELNILHNMGNNNIEEVINEINQTKSNNLEENKIIDNINIVNEEINEEIKEKKKRGRKKKIDIINTLNIFSKSDNKEIIQDNKEIISDEKNTIFNEKNTNSDESKNEIFKELLVRQFKNVCSSKKLQFNDIKRISKFLGDTIFDENKCSLWNGYITNEKNQSKGTYINFYFNKKKIALHRLLYINYIGEITNDEYIKFSCDNKGKCCTIAHMKKYTYYKNVEDNEQPSENNSSQNTLINNNIHINTNKEKLVVEF
jgi:hypothetical protein